MRITFPSWSSWSQPSNAFTSPAKSAASTSAAWIDAPKGTIHARALGDGKKYVPAPSRMGTRMSAKDTRSLLQVGEPRRVERSELATDVVDDDAHDEDAHEEIEQNADLHQERHGFDERHTHREDSVLEH